MAGIIFFFEDNDLDIFSGRRIDLAAWNYAIKAAGDIDKVIVINKTNQVITTFDSDLEFTVLTDVNQLNVSGSITCLACPWNNTAQEKISLWDFNHDTDWYFFGPASGWSDYDFMDNIIYVPQAGMGALHSVHIASVVMLHRYSIRN